MQRLNMFTRLSCEDQNLVLDLCSQLPYSQVVEILAQPRDQGGLSLVTSESSLSRFYTRHHPESLAIQAVGQFAFAVQASHQIDGQANFEAILALVQNRILESLRLGKPIAELDQDLRALARAQKCFLADSKYRRENPNHFQAYEEHVKTAARSVDCPDFIRNDIPEDPGAGDTTIENFQDELGQYQLDLEAACALPASENSPASIFARKATRIVAEHKRSARDLAYIARHLGKHPACEGDAAPTQTQPNSQHSTPETPAISHLSPDFTMPSAPGNPGLHPSSHDPIDGIITPTFNASPTEKHHHGAPSHGIQRDPAIL